MFKNFKIRISLWYAGLFTIIIASTLFTSYKIVSYQLKNEIKLDLETKTKFVQQTINSANKETGEHRNNEWHNHASEKKAESELFNFDFNGVKLFTEIADNNYSLFIFSGDKLIYITPKYRKLIHHIKKTKFFKEQYQNISFEGVPFSISTINHLNYTIYIGYELSAVKSLQRKLLHIFLIVFPISLLLSVLFGFVVTQKTMNVIEQIDSTAKIITSNNLGKRIKIPEGEDEISRLIITLNSMIDRLEKSFTQAKQFSQDAAHEIRTPLTIIRGEIEELIENERGNKKTIHTLENVLEEVQYLASISERLLLIHNMDTNNIKYHFEKINLSELLTEIYQDVLVLSMDKNISVDLETEDDIYISGNKELISRLLWNISDNAIKYNKKNGSAAIKLSQKDSKIQIQIKDTGIGIPETDIPKIFTRFYRVDKSRSRELGGSGLGLSICKWIVELHSGNIVVESEEGVGSEFKINLPIS